jgi:all-trans-retinol 13,14-reductase
VLPDPIRFFVSGLFRRSYLKYASKTTYEVMRELTDNEELIGVLTGQYGDCGLPPRQSSFVIHAAIAKHYMSHGGCYPVGGSAEFFNTMAPAILSAGGKVLTNAVVEKVIIWNGKATGVKMKGGREIHSDIVISGAGIGPTFNHLIDSGDLDKFPIAEYKSIAPSTSHFCLYIGLKGTSEELQLPKANFWLYPENHDHDENIDHYLEDIENRPFPVTYISFPSAKDPDWANRYPGKSTIEIITLGPYSSVEKWADSRWKKRGEDYEAFKERFSRRMLDKLIEVMPHLEDKIDYYELSTPLSTRHFANYDKGEIYGIDHTPARFGLKSLRPATPVKNFYLTGQDITTAGIAGALFGGVLTASAILKKNLLMDAMKMRGGE